MAFVIDILFLLLLISIVFLDIKRGFLRSSVGVARIFIAIAIAFVFSGILAIPISQQLIFPTVHKAVQEAVLASGTTDAALIDALPFGLRAIASLGDIDLQEIMNASSSSTLSKTIAQPISQYIAVAVSFIFLFVCAYFALKLLIPILSKALRSCALLKAADTAGGLLFGIIHAFIIGWGGSFLVGFLLPLFGASLSETYVILFFNHISPLKAIAWIFLR